MHAARFGQLFKRGEARLVGHEVLAVAHHAYAQRRAISRHGRGDDELNRGVFEDRRLVSKPLCLRKGPGKRVGQCSFMRIGVPADKRRAGVKQTLDLAVKMAMRDADDGEADHALCCDRNAAQAPIVSVRHNVITPAIAQPIAAPVKP